MAQAAAAGEEAEPAKGGGKRKLLLLLVPLLLVGLLAGLWFSGILPGLLGMGAPTRASGAEGTSASPRVPVFVDLPEVLTNLNAPGRRPTFIRLRAKLEVEGAEDATAVQAAMPRLMDLFQTYLRETRPEELRGSQGTYRLREELRARAAVAAHPARVVDVLFGEMIVQ